MDDDLRVLVVDDSRVVRSVISRALALSGASIAQIFEAENGQEAMALLRHEDVDVLFTDLHMPEMTGIELLEALQKQGRTGKLNIIVVSSDGAPARIEEVLAKGANAFLKKPFRPEEVFAAMNREST